MKLETITVEGSKFDVQLAEFLRPSATVLCMRGTFWVSTQRRIRAISDPAGVKTLVISSDGGWTEPAIELAKLAERYDWLIVIKDVCLSSCANYLFTSRAAKVLLPKSIVGWHGLPPDPSEVDKIKAQKPSGPEWASVDFAMSVANSKAFFTDRGIPLALGRTRPDAGHTDAYVAKLRALGDSGAKPFWSYGRKTLETKFKIRNILYMWEPRTPEEGTDFALKQRNTNIFFFNLSDHGRD